MADKKVLSEFARRAAQRMKDKKVSVKFKLYVPCMEQEMTFRTLLDDEVLECLNLEDNGDPNRSDKHAIYIASVEPKLSDVAQELMEAGDIQTPMEVMTMFTLRDITGMAKAIMEQSGVLGGESVHVVEKAINTLKN